MIFIYLPFWCPLSSGLLEESPSLSLRNNQITSSQISTLLRHEGEGNLDKDRRSRPDFDSVSAGSIAQRAILRSDGSRALRDFEISCPALSTHLRWEPTMRKGSPPHRRRRRVYGKHDPADMARPFHRTLIPRKDRYVSSFSNSRGLELDAYLLPTPR